MLKNGIYTEGSPFNKKMNMKNLLCLFGLFLTVNLTAQTTHQQTYWTRLFVKVKLDSNWTWQIEADERRLILPDKQLQFIAHTHLHRKLSKNTEGSLGVTFSSVRQGLIDVNEYRLFQEFYVYQNLTPKLRLSHRLRPEQRWFENVEKGAIVDGFNFKFRLRYRPQLDFKLNKKWSFKTNAEIMYHQDAYDQFRFFMATEYRFNPHLSMEMGYLKVNQQRSSGGFFDRDNLRTTFYFNL
jgi:hypothetical protein